jgi:nucleoside-diphosphate kinase
MIKPDGVKRGLVGEIISRFEKRGLKIEKLQMVNISRSLAEKHYQEHYGKDFFSSLVEYVTSGPSVIMVISGLNVVKIARDMIGSTNPAEAAAGTIRGDFALEISKNIIHGSDSEKSATREIELFFPSS